MAAGRAPAAYGADDVAAALSGPTADYRRMESVISSGWLTPAVESHLHLHLASRIVTQRLNTPMGFGELSEIAGSGRVARLRSP
ncbi:hypothetical protein GCM10027184_52620 [Saccharothrix stipae]